MAGAPHPPTYRPIESGSQVGDEHLGVDGLQVPGEVLAVKLLPQLAPFCNVTIRLLSTKSREKIKLTSEASQETPPRASTELCPPSSATVCHIAPESHSSRDRDRLWGPTRHRWSQAGFGCSHLGCSGVRAKPSCRKPFGVVKECVFFCWKRVWQKRAFFGAISFHPHLFAQLRAEHADPLHLPLLSPELRAGSGPQDSKSPAGVHGTSLAICAACWFLL